MCGICGKLNFDLQAPVSRPLLKAMTDHIEHRGPDDEGYYTSTGVGLGFRRLSIIDLSTGHQPISNEDGTVWIVFNGEIYNYRSLRTELIAKGHVFRSDTDTEVIVHLYEELGERCLEKLRGMFAFAIWDDRNKTLFLARDRVGIKPLYYYRSDECLIFGSEMKSILVDSGVNRDLNPATIDRILTFQYSPGSDTLFKHIYKLMPGCYLRAQGRKVEVKQYWDLQFRRTDISLKEAERRLVEILEETVRLHMISDVPVGFLLSGGLDSTGLLSIASAGADRQLSSFTVGFSGSQVTDERPYAKLAADRFHTEHHEITFSAKEFEAVLPKYIWHMEEPVCEPPAIALYYVSKLARNYVKVLISGEGGDEAFAGYQNYRSIFWLERFKAGLGPLAGVLSAGLSAAAPVLPRRLRKYAPLLGMPLESYYLGRTASKSADWNIYSDGLRHRIDREFSLHPATEALQRSRPYGPVNRMLYVDTKTWLPDDLLVKADKITMANSIELRVPLLDHELLEFAASLPDEFKVNGFSTKYILKRVMKNRVPPEIVNRKKTGFPVPYASWFRGELQPWVRDILLDRRTLQRGYFVPARVEELISNNFETGAHPKEIFSLAMLELWHRAFADSPKSPDSASVGELIPAGPLLG